MLHTLVDEVAQTTFNCPAQLPPQPQFRHLLKYLPTHNANQPLSGDDYHTLTRFPCSKALQSQQPAVCI